MMLSVVASTAPIPGSFTPAAFAASAAASRTRPAAKDWPKLPPYTAVLIPALMAERTMLACA
ncbi:hypothetical protein FHX63_004002 [Cupriavidus plantarum]|nr:hypothetical protein [Cupriavidus plantarum]